MLQLDFKPFPVIETTRLVLREITKKDAENFYRLRSSKEAMRYIDKPLAESLDEIRSFIKYIDKKRKDNEDEVSKGVIESALKKAFAPEFLNRIDDVIMFNSLQKEDIHKIIDIELASLFGRVNGLGFVIKISDAAKDYIVEKGYDVNYGARPLKRAIQKYLEDPMAEEIIKCGLTEGDEIEVDYDKEKDAIVVSTHKPKGKKNKKEDKS